MVLKSAAKLRGHSVDLPGWWLVSVNRRAQGRSLQELASELTAVVRRPIKWNHKTVGNFLKNEHATLEMMRAFCALFEGLPDPVIVARTFEEAAELHQVARRFDSNPEKTARKAEFDKAREGLTKRLDDQTAKLNSQDEAGVNVRRRPRGVVRGRPESS
jgi:hypothetical protein